MGSLSRTEKEAFLFSDDLDEAVKLLTKDQLAEIHEEREFTIKAYSTPEGKRVFLELISSTFLFQPYFGQNASSYAKEGKREIGLYYLKLLGTETFMSLYTAAGEQELEIEQIERGKQ